MFKVNFVTNGEAETVLLVQELSTETIALIKSVSESATKYWDDKNPSHTYIDISDVEDEDDLTDSYGQTLELSSQDDLLRELSSWINHIADSIEQDELDVYAIEAHQAELEAEAQAEEEAEWFSSPECQKERAENGYGDDFVYFK